MLNKSWRCRKNPTDSKGPIGPFGEFPIKEGPIGPSEKIEKTK